MFVIPVFCFYSDLLPFRVVHVRDGFSVEGLRIMSYENKKLKRSYISRESKRHLISVLIII